MKGKWENNLKKQTQSGISLIVLVITIIIILILAAAIIITLNNNNPVMEANKARYDSDVANIQAIFTNSVAKVMAQNRATVSVLPAQINSVTKGVKETVGEVSYIVENAMDVNNTSGKIIFDKKTSNTTTYYTGKKLPIYAAGETKWYVDSEGNISLEVAGVKYGSGKISEEEIEIQLDAGLYDENDNLIADWDTLVNQYKINIEKDYGSTEYDYNYYSPCKIFSREAALASGVKLVISDKVTSIGEYAFKNCVNLKSIIIPNTITTIKGWAFESCEGLTSISIPKSVTSIKYGTFGYCTNLNSVTIPNSVISIGQRAFINCSSLANITIPEGVKTIESGAFQACENLVSIVLPSTLESIENQLFYYCSSLPSIVIPEGITKIGAHSFEYCGSLNSVTIPDSVTVIESGAFAQCTSLESIMIPEKVTNIGTFTFDNCTNLTSIVIPELVNGIGSKAFRNCTALKSVYFKQSTVPEFGSNCFYKESGEKCTFYFKNSDVANAFEDAKCYNRTYAVISDNYNW